MSNLKLVTLKTMERIGDIISIDEGALRLLLPKEFKKRQTFKKTQEGNSINQTITYYFKQQSTYDIVVVHWSEIRNNYQLIELKRNVTAEQLIRRLLR